MISSRHLQHLPHPPRDYRQPAPAEQNESDSDDKQRPERRIAFHFSTRLSRSVSIRRDRQATDILLPFGAYQRTGQSPAQPPALGDLHPARAASVNVVDRFHKRQLSQHRAA